ncbi:unnamed protein product [Linum tenue]|uniref:Uncharacterized protein n=1 Tax=Linum tenue TaxID=586396 RepID=A0AAV0KDY8_9ROSI|nr:unnamed protein product [Linum tenue]CAI0419928.1 unnamed protein product [Linum tenue]
MLHEQRTVTVVRDVSPPARQAS